MQRLKCILVAFLSGDSVLAMKLLRGMVLSAREWEDAGMPTTGGVRASELLRYTSGSFTFGQVVDEVWEALGAVLEGWSAFKDEVRDVYTTYALWRVSAHGVDLWLPDGWSSRQKYMDRMTLCRDVLLLEDLYDPDRELREGFYFARYTSMGSNLHRPAKRLAFLRQARADYQGNGWPHESSAGATSAAREEDSHVSV